MAGREIGEFEGKALSSSGNFVDQVDISIGFFFLFPQVFGGVGRVTLCGATHQRKKMKLFGGQHRLFSFMTPEAIALPKPLQDGRRCDGSQL